MGGILRILLQGSGASAVEDFQATGLLEADAGNGVKRNMFKTSNRQGVWCVWAVHAITKILSGIDSNRRNGRVWTRL